MLLLCTLAVAGALLIQEASPAAAQAENPRALVTTQWVWDNLDNPKVRVVEVSVDPGVYETGHVRGAVGFKWHSELVDPIKRDIVSPENFAALLSRAGIAPDTTVVLYGDNNNWFAAWGLWIFKHYGHADVRLMDGGRTKWALERRPWDTTVPTYRPTQYTLGEPDKGLRVRLKDVLDVVEGRRRAHLVDVRSPDEYSGKVFAPPGIQELALRAGHIPGAKNIPWNRTVNEDGTFKSVAELRKLYADVGIDGSQPVITYCRIGERSSHSFFVLRYLLGYEVANYDGSSTEWNNTVGVPIVNTAGTVWTGK